MLFKKVNWKKMSSSIVLIALFLMLSIFISGADSMALKDIFGFFAIYAVGALALNVVCGCLGEFALGHGGFLLIGYTVAVIVASKMFDMFGGFEFYLDNVYNHNERTLYPLGYLFIIIDVLIAAAVTGLIGFLIGSIALGRLKGDYLAIVTLGFGLILVNVFTNVSFLSNNGQGINVDKKLSGDSLLFAIMLVFSLVLILTFMKSRFGRGILAIREDNIAAEASGVPVKKYKIMAFTFSAIIAGRAGGLFAHFIGYAPVKFNQDMSIKLLIIVVLGGLGSLTGTVLSALIIVLYEQWFCGLSWVPSLFTENPKIIYGVVLVVIMLFRTSGILGTSEFTWDWFYSKVKFLWKKIVSLFKKKTPVQDTLNNANDNVIVEEHNGAEGGK